MIRQKKCSSLMREMEGFLLLLCCWVADKLLLLIMSLILLFLVLVFLATDLTTFARTFPARTFPCHWSDHFCKNFSLSLIWSLLQQLLLACDLITFARTFPARTFLVRTFPCHWSDHFRKKFSCKNSSLALIWSLLQELLSSTWVLSSSHTFFKAAPKILLLVVIPIW